MKGVIVGLGKVGLSVSHYFAERFDLAGIDISPVEEFPGDLLRLDITDDSPAVTQALEGVLRGSDFILYTAISLQANSPSFERASWAVNAHGAGKIFALGAKYGVRRLVYYSSISVYVDPFFNDIPSLTEDVVPNPGSIPEEEGLKRIRTIYAATKLAGERQLARHSSAQSKGIVLRLSGPRNDDEFKANDYWHYTHMDDISHATERAIVTPLPDGDDAFTFGIFNIAQDHPDSNVSVQRAREILGYRPRFRHASTR